MDAGDRQTTGQIAVAERPAGTGQRIAWVDAAKGVSILLVVGHHVVLYLDRAGRAPAALVAANVSLASLRMPLFFLASGLFVAASLGAPWSTVLHKRVVFFGYLYLLWTLLRFGFFLVAVPPEVDPNDSTNLAVLAWSVLAPGPSMWFLYALALYTVIGKLARRVPPPVQLATTGVLSAFIGAEVLDLGNDRWTYMARYLFFFLLGWHGRRLIERFARSSTPRKVAAALVAAGVAAGGAVLLDLRTVPGVALALNLLAVAFGILCTAWISRYRIGRLLVLLGRQTLPVYLIHMLPLALIMIGGRHVEMPPAAAFVTTVVMTIALTVLSLWLHRLLVAIGAPWLFALPSRLAYRPTPPARHARRRGDEPSSFPVAPAADRAGATGRHRAAGSGTSADARPAGGPRLGPAARPRPGRHPADLVARAPATAERPGHDRRGGEPVPRQRQYLPVPPRQHAGAPRPARSADADTPQRRAPHPVGERGGQAAGEVGPGERLPRAGRAVSSARH